MLITFTCKEYENITMFGDIAKRLLTLMGQSGTVPGAIVAEDIPAALSSLQKGIEGSKSTQSSITNQSNNADEEPEVSLAHRALPLINMLKAAKTHHCNVMWK